MLGRLRQLLAKYEEVEILLKLGEYKPGGDKVTDEAVNKIEAIRQFLKQPTHEKSNFQQTILELSRLVQDK